MRRGRVTQLLMWFPPNSLTPDCVQNWPFLFLPFSAITSQSHGKGAFCQRGGASNSADVEALQAQHDNHPHTEGGPVGGPMAADGER